MLRGNVGIELRSRRRAGAQARASFATSVVRGRYSGAVPEAFEEIRNIWRAATASLPQPLGRPMMAGPSGTCRSSAAFLGAIRQALARRRPRAPLRRNCDGIATSQYLRVGNYVSALGLAHKTAERILKTADAGRWSVARVRAEAAKHRKVGSGGPTPKLPFVRGIQRSTALSPRWAMRWRGSKTPCGRRRAPMP